MRLAAKITLALCAVLIAGLVAQAILARQQLNELYQREEKNDLRILTRALSSTAVLLWDLAGESQARAYLDNADQLRSHILVEVLAPMQPVPKAPEGLSHVEDIVVDGSVVARLRATRILSTSAAYVDRLQTTQTWTTAILVLACVVVSMMLGYWLIARPIQTLVVHARAIGDGGFPDIEEARQRDEIGHLAREMRSMASKLQDASVRESGERRRSASLLQQLRHADRLSTVGKLASSLAHEMGTPLNVVSGRAQLIASGTDDDDIKSSANTICAQVDRLSAIIKELLSFARRKGVEKEETDVGELIDQAINLLQPLADGSEVTIVQSEHPRLECKIDPQKTLQILTNLVVNAVHAMPEGGTITLGARTEHFDKPPERRSAPGDYVVISVEDQGTGISEDDLEHIFEDFFTTKRAGQGTGLGLSVCQSIVREHGGWLSVESEIGIGTIFTVYLPREDA